MKSLDKINLDAITIAPFLSSGYANTKTLEEGIEKSYDTTLKLLDMMNMPEYKNIVYKGATKYTTESLNSNEAVDKIIETEVMYRVIIDNPKVSLRNIEALVIHDKHTEDIFPSSGIFETKLNLIPGVINKNSNYVEGIILAGYIPFEDDIKNLNATFKVLFKYEDDNGESHTIIYSTKK